MMLFAEDQELELWTVSPGLGGFIVFFVLMVVVWLLGRGLVRSMRRIDHRQRLDEGGAATGGTNGDASDDDGDNGDNGGGAEAHGASAAAAPGEDAASSSGPAQAR